MNRIELEHKLNEGREWLLTTYGALTRSNFIVPARRVSTIRRTIGRPSITSCTWP